MTFRFLSFIFLLFFSFGISSDNNIKNCKYNIDTSKKIDSKYCLQPENICVISKVSLCDTELFLEELFAIFTDRNEELPNGKEVTVVVNKINSFVYSDFVISVLGLPECTYEEIIEKNENLVSVVDYLSLLKILRKSDNFITFIDLKTLNEKILDTNINFNLLIVK